MKLLKITIVLLLIILAVSCDVTESTEIDIEFEQNLVIESRLIKDSLFTGVSITKTIPLQTAYNISSADVNNAVAILKINGVQVLPLHYQGDGLYMPLPKHFLFIKGGYTYELFVELDGKNYYAKTKIPEDPIIRNATYTPENYLTATVHANEGEAYAATWAINSRSITAESDDFFAVNSIQSGNPEVVVRTKIIDEQYQVSALRDSTYIRIYTFDKHFEDFFKTFGNSNSISEAFSQGGGQVIWNIEGENVIGLFIGYSKSPLINP